MPDNKAKKLSTDQKMDVIEKLSDQHQIHINITRVPGLWIANAQLPDGRQYSVQSPADQGALLDDILAAVARATGAGAGGAP